MPPVRLTRETWPEFRARIESLTANAPRKFGSMDAHQMLRHMRNVHETALEEVSYPDHYIPVVSKAILFLSTRVMKTWPHGKIKAPDFWTPQVDGSFDEEREKLIACVERFLDRLDAQPDKIVRNPFFGNMSLRAWSLLNGIHFHHHLRQFGV